MGETVKELPPRGHYLAHEVGRLAGVSGQQVGQWARNGYIRSSQSDGPPRIYSFQDVAEAMVVHELREHTVPYLAIKRTIRDLRDRYGSDWPLTRAQLATSRGRVYARADEALYDIGAHGWQQLNLEDNLRRIVGLLQRGGWAAREIPDLQHIEVDPERLSGRPTIRGRRVPAEKVARLAETQEGRGSLIEDYRLSEDEISDAQRWWAAAARFDEAA
jgi:uncharacterized protein (DUF433 family)